MQCGRQIRSGPLIQPRSSPFFGSSHPAHDFFNNSFILRQMLVVYINQREILVVKVTSAYFL